MEITIGIKLTANKIPAKASMAIKKATNLSLGDIKQRVEMGDYVFECPVVDNEGLKLINSLKRELQSLGVEFKLFEAEREVDPTLFDNLEELYDDISKSHC